MGTVSRTTVVAPYPLSRVSFQQDANIIVRRLSRQNLQLPSGLIKSVIAGALRTNWRSELM